MKCISWPIKCFVFPNLSTETTPVNHRRSRTKFTQDQLKILIKAFDKNPYPGYATKQKLALEANTEESRIQVSYKFCISKTKSRQGGKETVNRAHYVPVC